MKNKFGFTLLSLILIFSLGLFSCSSDTQSLNDQGIDNQSINDISLDLQSDTLTADIHPPRPDSLIQTHPTLENITLFVNLGDSIAAGWSSLKSYADLMVHDDNTRPEFKDKDLTTLFGSITVRDLAKAGSTSDELLDQLKSVPENQTGHTLVLISSGGNDILYDYQLALDEEGVKEFGKKVAENIDAVLQHFSDTTRYPGGVTLAFLNLYDPTDGTGFIPEDTPVVDMCKNALPFLNMLGDKLMYHLQLYNDALSEYAKQKDNVYLIDIHREFLGHAFQYADPQSPYYNADDPTLWFTYDCIHPNTTGHYGIRAIIWNLLFGTDG